MGGWLGATPSDWLLSQHCLKVPILAARRERRIFALSGLRLTVYSMLSFVYFFWFTEGELQGARVKNGSWCVPCKYFGRSVASLVFGVSFLGVQGS